MSHPRPFHRNFRPVKEGPNSGYSGWAYIIDKNYAKNPAHFIRAFLIIQKDLEKIFEFIEPSDLSVGAYSYRTHELLMRICIEVEANFKAILRENIYTPKENNWGTPTLNMSVYKKIDTTHHLSSYEVLLPIWSGKHSIFKPYAAWKQRQSLEWYDAYNKSKHDRLEAFQKANLVNLVEAASGLLVLLTAQFRDQDFSFGGSLLKLEGDIDEYHEMESAIGKLFRIRYPNDWKEEELYDFDWSVLQNQSDRFQKIDYDAI